MTPTIDIPLDEFGLSGTVIADRFAVEMPIAEGGFGLVYRAKHLGFDRPVAIKFLRVPRELKGKARETLLSRFTDEGRLLFELASLHAGIVRAIETGTVRTPTHGEVPFLVLEWLEGDSLERVMEHRTRSGSPLLSLPDILHHLDPVAQALAAAHERGVVHRDIKPSNIVFADVMGKRLAKILDFGIAKVMHDAWSVTSAKTSREPGSTGVFTPAYAAPEQWVTRFGATGPWTDVFSLALVCVELLSGVPALEGPAIPQFLGQCIDEAVRPTPRTRGAKVPDHVEAIFARALSVSSAARHRDVGELWDELKRAAIGMRADATGRLSLDLVAGDATTIYGAPLLGAHSLGAQSLGAQSLGSEPPATRLPLRTRRQPRRFLRPALLALPALLLGGVALFVMRAGEAELLRARAQPASATPPTPLSTTESTLTVLCMPYCSDIELDGKSLGPSPLVATPVLPGARELVMRREGTPDKKMSVLFRAGASSELSVSMDP